MKSKCFQPRIYRDEMEKGRFESFIIREQETDLWIGIDRDSICDEIQPFTIDLVRKIRCILDEYIKLHPEFFSSHCPLSDDANAPNIVRSMLSASALANVGPMAAVAGAIAELVGRSIVDIFNVQEIVVENGGDIWLSLKQPINLGVYAGSSGLAKKLALEIPPSKTPMGVCTSSGTVGHSFSYGKADAVMVACKDAALADAYATALCNEIKTEEDIQKVLRMAKERSEILSCAIVMKDLFGVTGSLALKTIARI